MVDAWGVRRTDMEGYDGVPRRTIFVLDPEMKVRWRWITSPEQRLPDTTEVLTEAKKVGEAPVTATRRAAPSKSVRNSVSKSVRKTDRKTERKKP